MTERDFLLAIHENPDDDAPRLMFADWLSENGQDERAELVRVQCELDRLERRRKDCLTCPTCEERDGAIHDGGCRYQALRKREAELLHLVHGLSGSLLRRVYAMEYGVAL